MPALQLALHGQTTFSCILGGEKGLLQMDNWKQWKQKPEMENGNGKNLVQINARVKPLINDHLCAKITSV